ncbi:hypothetical protein IMSAG185_01537 [Lachnospiraceae bacterium]|nr:hypothetical protein IMSAG185_01537 [Lachnospiraceae bacterium]
MNIPHQEYCFCLSFHHLCVHRHFPFNGKMYPFCLSANPCHYMNFSIFAFYHRCHLNAWRPVLFQFKMTPRYTDQIHIPIQSSIKCKVRLLGIHPVICGIVHSDIYLVFFFHHICDVHPERGITAIVDFQKLTIYLYRSCHCRTVKFQKSPVSRLPEMWSVETFSIQAGTAIIIVSTILSVYIVPCMRQCHLFPFHGLCSRHISCLDKIPPIIKIFCRSHPIYPFWLSHITQCLHPSIPPYISIILFYRKGIICLSTD